jgi:hypothetical protein
MVQSKKWEFGPKKYSGFNVLFFGPRRILSTSIYNNPILIYRGEKISVDQNENPRQIRLFISPGVKKERGSSWTTVDQRLKLGPHTGES